MKRQKLLLIVLLAVLALAVTYAWKDSPRMKRVSAPGGGKAPRAERAPGAAQSAEESPFRLRLELLSRDVEEYDGVARDLFSPLYVVRIAPPPPPTVLAPPPPPPVVVAAPPPPPPQQTAARLAAFTFLGYLEKGGEKMIFLSSEKELFVAKKGERFGRDKEFLVTSLSPEKLVVRQGEDPREIVITLTEKAPLAPGRSKPFRP